MAEAALRPVELEHAEEVPVKLMELFEEVAREADANEKNHGNRALAC